MKETWNWRTIAGTVLHVLIGGLMIFAGAIKVFGLAPAEALESMRNSGLGGLADNIRLIGAGEVLTAVLLVIPRTSSLGILLASAFWGGAICTHMTKGDSYTFVAVLLLLSWLGAYLRNPATFASFAGRPATQRKGAQELEPVLS
jgi:hypothetical protein